MAFRFLFLGALVVSSALSAQNHRITIDGADPWPPKGEHCETFVRCCEQAAATDSDVDLACQLLTADESFTCEQGIRSTVRYLKEKGQAAPEACYVEADSDQSARRGR